MRGFSLNPKSHSVFGIQELSFNSMGLFGWELVPHDFSLVVLHTVSIISFHLWCMLGGSVDIWFINLFRFIDSQTHFSTSMHAKNGTGH